MHRPDGQSWAHPTQGSGVADNYVASWPPKRMNVDGSIAALATQPLYGGPDVHTPDGVLMEDGNVSTSQIL